MGSMESATVKSMQIQPPPGFTPDGPAPKKNPPKTQKRVKRDEIEDLAEELGIPYATAERQFLDDGYTIA